MDLALLRMNVGLVVVFDMTNRSSGEGGLSYPTRVHGDSTPLVHKVSTFMSLAKMRNINPFVKKI